MALCSGLHQAALVVRHHPHHPLIHGGTDGSLADGLAHVASSATKGASATPASSTPHRPSPSLGRVHLRNPLVRDSLPPVTAGKAGRKRPEISGVPLAPPPPPLSLNPAGEIFVAVEQNF